MSYSIEQLYGMWLKGYSLRRLAAISNKPHGSIHNQFRKLYGRNACNLRAKSLVRSVLEDYEGNDKVATWAMQHISDESTSYHKSNHSLQQLSNYQTLHEEYILDQVEASEDDYDSSTWGFLRLPFYMVTLAAIAKALTK